MELHLLIFPQKVGEGDFVMLLLSKHLGIFIYPSSDQFLMSKESFYSSCDLVYTLINFSGFMCPSVSCYIFGYF